MKKNNAPLFLALVSAIFLISSCSTLEISQRRYNKGLNIAFAWQYKDITKEDKAISSSHQPKLTISEITPLQNTRQSFTTINDLAIINTHNLETNAVISTNFDTKKELKKELKRLKKEEQNFISTFDNNNQITTATIMASSTPNTEVGVASKGFLFVLLFMGIMLSPFSARMIEGGFTIRAKTNLLLYILSLIASFALFPLFFFIPFLHLIYITLT